MTPRKRRSSEPRHLARMQKTCPRRDCPNPTRGMEWRGSPKQLQYHCYGCWRKFNYGGNLRSWATQVTPSVTWLRGLPEHERSEPPDLLDPPRRSVSPEPEPILIRRSVSPAPEPPRRSVSPVPDPRRRSVSPVPPAQQVHGLATGQAEGIASSSQMTGPAGGLYVVTHSDLALGPVELGFERNLRARAYNLQRTESGASATLLGHDREGGGTASADIDLVGNGVGEDALHGIRAPTSPTWHDLKIDLTPFDTFDEFGVGGSPSDLLLLPFGEFGVGGWNKFIPQPLGEFGVDDSALPTLSFDSTDPENNFWEDAASSFGIEFPGVAVLELPGTIIIPGSDDSNDVQSPDYSITASSANPTAENTVGPQGKTVKISFLRYAVPTVTCMYAVNC